MVERTSQPMSAVPPTTEAMITIENAAMVVWLTPTIMVGRAAGIRASHRVCHPLVPDISADSMMSGGTRSSPRMTLRTMGGVA